MEEVLAVEVVPLYRKRAELGWLGVAISEEYGGSGWTYVEQTILFEELYRGLAPIKALGPTTTVAGCVTVTIKL